MLLFMFLLLVLFGVAIFLSLLILSACDTRSNGLFIQGRVGQYGKLFRMYKFRTMHQVTGHISVYGAWMRKYKFDELPQLWNIIKGEMTLVGPRPDVPGYADSLEGENQLLLNLKPGITGLASLKYRNEEQLLSLQEDPKKFNDEVIWPDKVRINVWYARNRSVKLDLIIIFYTLFPFTVDVDILMKKHSKTPKMG